MLIDHIGIVVSSIEEGILTWEKCFGYRQNSDIVLNTRQQVRVVFLVKDNSTTVKLIEPSDATSSIAALARRGGGVHHLCFKCTDLGPQLDSLRKKGMRVVVPPQPGEAFMNHPIAFLVAEGNLNVELIDTDEKAGLTY